LGGNFIDIHSNPFTLNESSLKANLLRLSSLRYPMFNLSPARALVRVAECHAKSMLETLHQ
jgi:hypothetical protein